VRGTLVRPGLAESPPHPDRKNDPTSPRKRGEVIEAAYGRFNNNRSPPAQAEANRSDMHRGANAAGVSEHAQIAFDFGRAAGGFFRIVREFHGGPPVDAVTLQTIEIGSRSTEPSGAHPTKSLVRLCPSRN